MSEAPAVAATPVSPWKTLAEAAEYARCSEDRLGDACRDGSLPASQKRFKGRWRIHVRDLDDWIRGETPSEPNKA